MRELILQVISRAIEKSFKMIHWATMREREMSQKLKHLNLEKIDFQIFGLRRSLQRDLSFTTASTHQDKFNELIKLKKSCQNLRMARLPFLRDMSKEEFWGKTLKLIQTAIRKELTSAHSILSGKLHQNLFIYFPSKLIYKSLVTMSPKRPENIHFLWFLVHKFLIIWDSNRDLTLHMFKTWHLDLVLIILVLNQTIIISVVMKIRQMISDNQ